MSAVPAPSRMTSLLLAGYPLLAIAGAVAHRPLLSLAALLLLLTAWMGPRLRAGHATAWLAWGLAAAAGALLARLGYANALLEAVPIAIVAGISAWFGLSLRAGREPRVARFIRVLEGPQQLGLPRVARYARGVTAFWCALLGAQALVLVGLLGTALAGTSLPRWVLAYQHVGGYLVIPLAFGIEYAFRRWYLRDLPHVGLHAQGLQLMRCWPQLLRGEDGAR
ncbi:MAG TPA: xanthomonadin biosynthesis protein [Dyella sp.]|nr:xanthomonadin biosynthesis protein [Dyella sp.]